MPRPGKAITRRGFGTFALAALIALALPAMADAFWQYRGHVRDQKRTTLQLVVRHSRHEPRAVISATTGRLALRCDQGKETKPLGLDFGFRLAQGGGFSVGEGVVGVTVGPGGTHHHRTSSTTSIRGTIHRRRAAGFLRLKTNNHGPKGKCDSGRLRWRAQFVARAG